jgi:ABC-type xylose transport system permease subunit
MEAVGGAMLRCTARPRTHSRGPLPIFALRLIGMCAIVEGIVWLMNDYIGVPIAFAILAILLDVVGKRLAGLAPRT